MRRKIRSTFATQTDALDCTAFYGVGQAHHETIAVCYKTVYLAQITPLWKVEISLNLSDSGR